MWKTIALIEEFFKRIRNIEVETDDNGYLEYEIKCDDIISISAPALLQWTCSNNKLVVRAYSFTEMEEKWIIQENNILVHYHIFKSVKAKIKLTVK